ncbi:MAG: sulfurtransferase complex subunit TusD [Moraxella sp.]|nr:sulfurtransferase complex subunit TusD [Moraxella sp.]
MQNTVVLITCSPDDPKMQGALTYVKLLLAHQACVSVFFYADGAYIANRLRWQSADVPNLADEWVELANKHNLALPVCVSTALARGITDIDNAKRHQLDGDNLRAPFRLVGLSELAMMITDSTTLVQY